MKNRTKVAIVENEFVTVWYYPDQKIIHHQFHKFLYGDALHDALNKGLEAFKAHGATKWLSDDRENSALPKADLDWGQTNWRPRMQAARWKYWAIMQPKKVIGQLNIQHVIDDLREHGVTVKAFTDEEEALAWLENQP